MARFARIFTAILLLCSLTPAARGQFFGVAVGRQLSQTLADETTSGSSDAARTEFGNGSVTTVDAGMPIAFPYVSAGLHYNYSKTDLNLERGDAFGSSAEARLRAHTITVDARLRSPSIRKFRLYGVAGGGFTRFGLDVNQEVESPFPGGSPDSLTSVVFTYGGGVERHLRQLLHLRLEVRDYVAPISEKLYGPGGPWHRVVILGGITVGL